MTADDFEPYPSQDEREFAPRGGPSKPMPLDFVPAASFHGSKPCRRYLVPGPDLFAVRNVHALYGDGGTGKSLLLLQLAVAMATGTSWLGFLPTPGVVCYFSAEDDHDETTIRLMDIAENEGLSLEAVTDLRIAIMAGKDAILATEDGKLGQMRQTPLFERLRLSLEAHRPRVLILDNLADVFAGNENSKQLARQFISMLRGLAIDYDCTVILAAHPSISGMSSGTGTSGNTAWNNSVRSRLYLKRQHDDPKEIMDPDFRRLVTMKSNYSPTGGEIGMRWERGRFVPTETPANAMSAGGALDRMAAASKAERVFLQLVQRFEDEGRNVSPSPSANYAPLLFAKHPENEGVLRRQFEIAMDTLFAAKQVVVREVGPPSKLRKTIVVAEADEPSEGDG